MAAIRKTSESSKSRRPPATTPEARENQLMSLAVDYAERQLLEGTAPAAVLTHYLKLATTRERLEQKKLEHENLLLEAKIESMKSGKQVEELYRSALNAMRIYSGQEVENPEEGYDD